MIKAAQLYPPVDLDDMVFRAPEGIEFVRIDSTSHLPANAACSETYTESFITGTVPAMMCPLHGNNPFTRAAKGIGDAIGGFFGRLFTSKPDTPAAPSTSSR